MATSNAINANSSGFVSYDGAGTFSGRTLQGGSNVTITNPDGIPGNPTISISGISSTIDVTGTTQAMSISTNYIADNASLVTFTLPSTAILGDVIQVWGKGAGGWKITQAAGQQINIGKVPSTAGTGGSVASTNQFDTIELRCITAGASTIWTSKVNGNITVI